MKPIFFNAHHAPIGACATFTLGCKGASGGLGLELGHPAGQNVFIGVESDNKGRYLALPFFTVGQKCDVLQQFVPAAVQETRVLIGHFPDSAVQREYRLGSDTWRAENLRFTIYSPVTSVPDPVENSDHLDLPRTLLPAVIAELEIDNSKSSTGKRAFFGFSGNEGDGMRFLADAAQGWCGVGQGRTLAICTDEPSARPGIGFTPEDILDALAKGEARGGLGNTALLTFDVPAECVLVVRFAVCFFYDGPVTAGIEGTYLYRRYFTSIESVAKQALTGFRESKDAALAADCRIDTAKLPEERRFMLIHAIQSYYGSTQLLDTPEGPLWVVNEGEYRMINTLDLTIDHLFFEMTMNPWTVRNVLDRYATDFAYRDTVSAPGGGGSVEPGGVSFTHDMGVANVFSSAGHSAYERPGERGLFSYMTHEQLLNWTISSAVYALRTGDNVWPKQKQSLLLDCFQSLLYRDHEAADRRTGFMQADSSRCVGGSEITTYDSLDPSLGRARGNSYVAMKRWAAFVLLRHVFEKLECGDMAGESLQEAQRTAAAILSNVNSRGFVPALPGEGVESVTLPLAEGLIYPWYAGCREVYEKDGAFAPLITAVRRHFEGALSSGICRCVDGGWRLSSASDITWLSKLYLLRFIATEILGIEEDASFVAADNAHCRWLLDERNIRFAWSDQFKNGEVVGSRYYPRGVTGILWLERR